MMLLCRVADVCEMAVAGANSTTNKHRSWCFSAGFRIHTDDFKAMIKRKKTSSACVERVVHGA